MTQPARISAPAPARGRGPASTENGQRSRDRVLQAAVDLITEAGIDQVRLAEIARRAGMSSGQVMYYFTSKEHILLETLAWCEHEDVTRASTGVVKAKGAWKQLEYFLGRYLPTSPADPTWILWLEAWARAPHNRQVGHFLERLHAPWRDVLAGIVDRGVREGVFVAPESIDDFTLRYTAMLDGFAILRIRYMHQPSRKRLIELAVANARIELTSGAAAAGAPTASAD